MQDKQHETSARTSTLHLHIKYNSSNQCLTLNMLREKIESKQYPRTLNNAEPDHWMHGSRRLSRHTWTSQVHIAHNTTTVLWPFFRDHPGEPVPEENFWALWCKGRLTEADTQTIWLGATPSGLTSAYLHHPPIFLQAGCPSCRPTHSVQALKAMHIAHK